jgi:hypothetical protein
MSRDGSGTYSLPEAAFQSGQVISSTAVNSDLSDIAAALTASIAKDGQTTPSANLPMGGYKHTNVAVAAARTDYARTSQVQDGAFDWGGTAGGTADALTLTPSPAITAYAAGGKFRFIAGASPNTGAATVAVSGLAAKAIQNAGSALTAGDIAAGKMYEITYDGTQFQITAIALAAVPAASETVAGKIEIATAAETTTGTDDTRAITPAKLTTFAPASATIDTANDKLIVLDATDSKLKQMAFPTVSSDVTCYQVTDSTDISLSQVATQTNVGSTFIATIPTKGMIGLYSYFKCDIAQYLVWGIRIGSTNYFAQLDVGGATTYVGPYTGGANVSLKAIGGSMTDSGGTNYGNAVIMLGIEALSIPTGAQTVQIICSKNAAAATILKGTAYTTRVNVAIFDHS